MRYKTIISYQLSVISFFLLIFTAGLKADYINPPLWQDSVDYTHQSWDFGNDEYAAPVLPALPDGEPNWVNYYGLPRLTAVDYNDYPAIPGIVTWMYDYGVYSNLITDRRAYYGGMGNVFLTFRVPNNLPSQYYKTLVWIQMTYFARNDGIKNYNIEVARDDDFSDTADISVVSLNFEPLNEPEGLIGKWYRVTTVYEINQPDTEEYIRLTAYKYPADANHYMGGAAIIDQVDIDCRSVSVADFDKNDIINMIDFAFFANQWQLTGPGLTADFDKNLVVDYNDLAFLISQWMQTGQLPTGDLNRDAKVDMTDFARFANQWQLTGPGLEADFDDSLSVDFRDLADFADNWLSGL
ncbi:MAG: hypothetical protein PHP01_05755 [Phycisphaerae bacterium]|nr:hypothetical protein [Phycisphaerae bacterium]